jgi:hypothetical protein
VSAAERANPNVARRWTFGAICIPSLFDQLRLATAFADA